MPFEVSSKPEVQTKYISIKLHEITYEDTFLPGQYSFHGSLVKFAKTCEKGKKSAKAPESFRVPSFAFSLKKCHTNVAVF